MYAMTAEAQPSDETLIRRAQKGDEEALRELHERYEDVLQRRIRGKLPAHLGRKFSVADVLQEARLAVFRHAGTFEDRGAGSFRNWLLTIVDRKLHDLVRRHMGTAKRGERREVSRGRRMDTANFVAVGPSPSQIAIGSELEALVRAAMDALPEDYREILRLAREECLSLREVAERMGRSRDAVKKLYWRALQRFRQELQIREGERHGP
jgi:RNA polymerase sigma-70 factor (ECF subfamily)